MTLWGKSDFTDHGEWLPLYQHIADTAAVAGALWADFLPAATKNAITMAFNDDAVLARKTAVWLAAAHDVGKATPAFSCQMPWLRDKAADVGMPFHPSVERDRRKLPHSMASYLVLRDWLMNERSFSQDIASMYACIPLGHHGAFTSPAKEYDGLPSHLMGDQENWLPVQRELAAFAASLAGLTDEDLRSLATHPLPQAAGIAITGLTILADWIASTSEYFPLRATPRDPSAAAEAMSRLGLPPPWRAECPDDATLFREHLGLDTPRPLQTGLVEVARSLTRPEFLILEAPTGDGKTKAALAASEVLATKFGLGGVLFALPTQATSDGIFSTVRTWLASTVGTTDVSLELAHGKAQFNAEYNEVQQMSRVFDPDGGGRIVAHSYLAGRAKLATMSDFVVGTIDQLLLGALRAKHVVLRHLGVAGKVVIIDEVHAADAFMRRYLCRMLTWLAAYDVPVIAMSATLTPSIRHELIRAYNAGLNRRTPRVDDEAILYPRITRSCADGAEVVALATSARSSTVTVDELPGSTDDLAAAALAAATQGGNVAVVCDTVRRAQDIYRALRASDTGIIDLVLLHSRFLTPERLTKEQELRERLGPAITNDQRPLIVVATQVIEQSLDIDFDVMFSDIAPLDLLIQRAGRLHRHEWKNASRPNSHRAARLILTGFERVDGGAPHLDPGCATVYGAASLLRTIATLDEHFESHNYLTSPDDVAALVTRAYETIEGPPTWAEAWEVAEQKADELQASKKTRARMFLISPPGRKALVNWDALPLAGDPTGERAIAQVRDAEDSIEVVVIQRIAGTRVIPQWAAEMSSVSVEMGTVIEDDTALAASKNTVRLPGFLGTCKLGDQLIDELEANCIDTWQNSRWLRGALPLVLDEDGNAQHASFDFHYDTDLGLVVTPQEKK